MALFVDWQIFSFVMKGSKFCQKYPTTQLVALPIMKGNSGTTTARIGWSKNPVSSQTDELMAGTKFSDYLGLKHYKKQKTNILTI